MDLSISASLDGKCLRHISDNEIRISGNNRPYFREQAVKNVLHGMDLLWIYDGAFVRDTIELGRLYKTIKDNLQNVRIKKTGWQTGILPIWHGWNQRSYHY